MQAQSFMQNLPSISQHPSALAWYEDAGKNKAGAPSVRSQVTSANMIVPEEHVEERKSAFSDAHNTVTSRQKGESESDGGGGSTGDDTCACENCVDCPVNTWRDASRQADGCFLATGYTRSGRDSLCAP